MLALEIIEAAARRLNALQTTAARNRAAFSWDQVKFTKAPAGFPNDNGESSDIWIPSSLYALPIEVPSWDEVEMSPRPRQIPGILTREMGKKKFYREVSRTPVFKLSDLDFAKACSSVGGVTHLATHDLVPMQAQPPWVTFAMSHYEASCLARLGRPRWESYCATRAWKHDITSTDHIALFLQKAVLGAFDLFVAHADLFEIPPAGITGVDVARVSAEIVNCMKYDDNKAYKVGMKYHEYFKLILSNLQCKSKIPNYFSREAIVETLEAIQKFLIQTLEEYGGCEGAIKTIRNYDADEREFLELITRIQKKLPILVREWKGAMPPFLGWGHNEFTCSPLVDVLITWGTLDESLSDPAALRTYIENNAYALVTEAKHADPKMVRFAKSLLQIWCSSGILVSGGEAQRMEYQRMAKAGWPHILSGTNSHRGAKPYITVGSLGDLGFSVQELDTVKASHFVIPLENMHLLCDNDGNFLPYGKACEVLRKEYDDFSGDTTELKEFIANELPKASHKGFQEAFEPVLAMRFNITKCYGFELNNDSFHRCMHPDGVEGEPLPEVSFSYGPEKYVMIALPPTKETPPEAAVAALAAHGINNGYSDYGKKCWLISRGFPGKDDEIHVKHWDPKKDLNAKQYKDWLDWCYEVVREDAGGQLCSYDGKYEIHHLEDLRFAAVTWRTQ